MSYIDKNSNTVISARLTNEGRKLLSLGLLTFNTFRLGDSNIDYSTLGSTYDISLENIIRAKAENPDIKTPLLPNSNLSNTYSSIPTLSPLNIQTIFESPRLGFFQYGSGTTVVEYTAYTDTVCHVLQADAIIPVTGMTGSRTVPIKQSNNYGSNTYEPQIGDVMLVKMSNNVLSTDLGPAVINLNTPVPYLWYQIQNVSGSLAANTLEVTVDRNFANFSAYTTSNNAYVTFYPLGTGGTQNKLFTCNLGFFSGGCVWNMNNVWSYPIAGTNYPGGTYESFDKYGSETYIGSKEYFGYTSEIGFLYTANTACNLVPSISIIHYTNCETCASQSETRYGQKFYADVTTGNFPKLIMPTLMWHATTTPGSIGQVFFGTGNTKYVTLSGSNTTVKYRDVVDNSGNKVGRVYPELQMFTIDDQELVAALSYKSNRNWTLPRLNTGLVANTDGIINSTQNLFLSYLFVSSSGYTTGLHSQYVTCVNFTTEECNCAPTLLQNVNFSIPAGQLPYMTVSGGTGWQADRFYLIAQRQQIGTNPTPNNWTIIDYTSQINGHTVGNIIDPNNLYGTTFTLNNTTYLNSGTTYDLSNFISIPTQTESEYLNFGDERFFFGNVETNSVIDKYRTKFVFTVPPNTFNTSTNPTYSTSTGQNVHINEVAIYDVNKNLVAIGKMNLPIEKVPNATIIIEIAFDL